jgi:hypothetical protein
VLVDLSRLTVLAEESSENTLTAHPQNGGGHTSLSGTTALTGTRVTTQTLGSEFLTDTEAGVGSVGLLDDKTVLGQLHDTLA